MNDQLTIYTIGHSTRSETEFVDLLRSWSIARVVDVRTIPRSRHNPQFNKETLAGFLRNRRISYVHMKELGGLRRPVADSLNSGWQNASFRGYADYMQTAEFHEAVERLITLAAEKVTAIMCAEAVPWRCHRSLIADALLVRGIAVTDIIGSGSARAHVLTRMARVHGSNITYPEPGPEP